METNNLFNFKRLLLLMRRQIFSSAKSLLIAFGGMAGTLLIISLLVAYFNPAGPVWHGAAIPGRDVHRRIYFYQQYLF
jgi:hypothetical protein